MPAAIFVVTALTAALIGAAPLFALEPGSGHALAVDELQIVT